MGIKQPTKTIAQKLQTVVIESYACEVIVATSTRGVSLCRRFHVHGECQQPRSHH
jgi:hypothetical protein